MGRCSPAAIDVDRDEQRHHPQPEDDLDLPEEMEQPRPDARDRGQFFRGSCRVVLRLQPVCEDGNAGGNEGVHHGEQKDRGGDEVERVDLDSRQQDVDKPAVNGDRIRRQRQGKRVVGLEHE